MAIAGELACGQKPARGALPPVWDQSKNCLQVDRAIRGGRPARARRSSTNRAPDPQSAERGVASAHQALACAAPDLGRTQAPRLPRTAVSCHGLTVGRGDWPVAAAIGRWLRRWALTRQRQRRGAQRGPVVERPHLTPALRPNDVWSVDFKGWFWTGDRTRVDPLTVRDMASRYILAADLLPDQSVRHARVAFTQLFRARGLPHAIRVDNGCPFGADGALGLTRLSAWWVKLGIRVEFITPGCPGENASHEQMHRVYKDETAAPPAPTLRAQKRRSRRWRHLYNHLRPHEALGLRCPAEFYCKSPRKLPEQLGPLRYPQGWETRLVKGKGMISLDGRGRFVGEAFEGERVGLKRTPSGCEVYFAHLLVGTLAANELTGIHAVRYRPRKA